jgi:adenylate cyclase
VANSGFRNMLLAHRTAVQAALGVTAGLAAALALWGVASVGALDRFEWVIYDRLVRLTSGHVSRHECRAAPDILVMAIDDKALRAFDDTTETQWPWPRGMHALIIDFCRAGGAKAVVFDVMLERTRRDDTEEQLTASLQKASAAGLPVVLGFSQAAGPSGEAPGPEFESRAVEVTEDPGAAIAEVPHVRVPFKAFLESCTDIGHVNAAPEGDGVMRRTRLLIRHGDKAYPSLALATAWRLAGRPPLRLEPGALWFGHVRVPLDSDGQTAVRWNGPPPREADPASGTYENVSCLGAIDHQIKVQIDNDPVAAARVPLQPSDVAGKVVLIGATAPGLLDAKASPFSDVHPGVELHANVIDNLLAGRFLDRRWDDRRQVGVWALLAVAAGLAGAMLSALRGLPVLMLLLAAAAAGGWWLFDAHGVSYRLLPPAVAMGGAYLAGLAVGYSLESSQKAWVQGAFSHFLSREVLDILMRHPERLGLGGERLNVTVFFSDVAGFTALSEQVTPEQLVTYLNRYLTRMSDLLLARGAYIDKFIGDAIMAFWGAPNPDRHHARNACLAALDCVAEMERLADEFRAEGFPPLSCRIGLNTGPVICGMMGSRQKLNYTVMGDTVNTASRLEGANKAFGSRILTGEETLAAAGEGIVAREVDVVRVKGRHRPVRLYEIVGRAEALSDRIRECLRHYEEGLTLYRRRLWSEARECFARAAEFDYPGDSPSAAYVRRCLQYAEHPPPADWDGVYEMKTK